MQNKFTYRAKKNNNNNSYLYAFISLHKFFHNIIFLNHFEVQKHDNNTSNQTHHTYDYDELMIGRQGVFLNAYCLQLRLYAVYKHKNKHTNVLIYSSDHIYHLRGI